MPVAAKTVERMIEWLEDSSSETELLHTTSFISYSEYSCSSRSRSFSGISFREYIEKRRLENAARLSEDTDNSLIDIALDCGFLSNDILSETNGRKRSNMHSFLLELTDE